MKILSRNFWLYSLAFITTTLLLLSSCRKVDRLHTPFDTEAAMARFFDDRTVTNPEVKAVIQSLKQKDAKYDFAPTLVKKAGYPIWNKTVSSRVKPVHARYAARGNSETDTSYFYTPFADDEYRNIQAVLVTRAIGEDTTYKFILANDYKDYPVEPASEGGRTTSADVARLFLYFENLVFQNEIFEIKDQARIKLGSGFIMNVRVSSLGSTLTVCYDKWFDPDSETTDPCHCSGNEYYVETHCESTSIGGGSGEGGGGGENPPPPAEGGGGTITGLYTPSDPNPFGSYPDPDIVRFQEEGPVSTFDGWGPREVEFTPEPIDSVLVRQSRAINRVTDSVMGLSLANNWEYSFIIVEKGGVIYPKNVMTSQNKITTRFNYNLAPGETLIGELHTHPDPVPKDRPTFSPQDLTVLRGFKNKLNYTMYVECGNVRYVLVIEDVGKATAFFNARNNNSIISTLTNDCYTHQQATTNWQQATQDAVKNT